MESFDWQLLGEDDVAQRRIREFQEGAKLLQPTFEPPAAAQSVVDFEQGAAKLRDSLFDQINPATGFTYGQEQTSQQLGGPNRTTTSQEPTVGPFTPDDTEDTLKSYMDRISPNLDQLPPERRGGVETSSEKLIEDVKGAGSFLADNQGYSRDNLPEIKGGPVEGMVRGAARGLLRSGKELATAGEDLTSGDAGRMAGGALGAVSAPFSAPGNITSDIARGVGVDENTSELIGAATNFATPAGGAGTLRQLGRMGNAARKGVLGSGVVGAAVGATAEALDEDDDNPVIEIISGAVTGADAGLGLGELAANVPNLLRGAGNIGRAATEVVKDYWAEAQRTGIITKVDDMELDLSRMGQEIVGGSGADAWEPGSVEDLAIQFHRATPEEISANVPGAPGSIAVVKRAKSNSTIGLEGTPRPYEELVQSARENEDFRDFYTNFGRNIAGLFDVEDEATRMGLLSEFASIWGATASQAEPRANTARTVGAMLAGRLYFDRTGRLPQTGDELVNAIQHGRIIDSATGEIIEEGLPIVKGAGIFGDMVQKTLDVWNKGEVKVASNAKTPTFALNTIAGYTGEFSPLNVIDRWMGRVYGYTGRVLDSGKNKGKHVEEVLSNTLASRYMSAMDIQIADELGWRPDQVQSALWFGEKKKSGLREITTRSGQRALEGSWEESEDYIADSIPLFKSLVKEPLGRGGESFLFHPQKSVGAKANLGAYEINPEVDRRARLADAEYRRQNNMPPLSIVGGRPGELDNTDKIVGRTGAAVGAVQGWNYEEDGEDRSLLERTGSALTGAVVGGGGSVMAGRSLRGLGNRAGDVMNIMRRLDAPVVDATARSVVQLHSENGGATFNPHSGDLAGTDNYAVAYYPERGQIIDGQPTPEQIQDFIARNSDVLGDERNAVGTWFNEKDGKTYLDISRTTPDLEEAVRLGREKNQIAVFNLRDFTEVPTGGTGEIPVPEGVSGIIPRQVGGPVEPQPTYPNLLNRSRVQGAFDDSPGELRGEPVPRVETPEAEAVSPTLQPGKSFTERSAPIPKLTVQGQRARAALTRELRGEGMSRREARKAADRQMTDAFYSGEAPRTYFTPQPGAKLPVGTDDTLESTRAAIDTGRDPFVPRVGDMPVQQLGMDLDLPPVDPNLERPVDLGPFESPEGNSGVQPLLEAEDGSVLIATPSKFRQQLSTVADRAQQLRYSSLLSAPAGAIGDIISNFASLPRLYFRTAIAAGGEEFLQGIGVLDRADRATTFSELGAMHGAVGAGLVDGMKRFVEVMANGSAPVRAEQPEGLFKGKKGLLLETGQRLRVAADVMVSHLGETLGTHMLAARQATREGLQYGKPEYTARVQKLVGQIENALTRGEVEQGGTAVRDNLTGGVTPDALAQEVKAISRRLVFQQEQGSMAKQIGSIRYNREAGADDLGGAMQAGGIVGWLIPFYRTLSNIAAEGVTMTPGVGAVGIGLDLKRGGGAYAGEAGNKLTRTNTSAVLPATQRAADQALGLIIASAAGAMVAGGMLTGSGPADRKDQEALKAEGWQPYSLKIGDSYVPVTRVLGPVAFPLVFGASLYEAAERDGSFDEKALAQFVAAIQQNWFSQSGLKAYDELLNNLGGERDIEKTGKNVNRFVASAASSFIPQSGLMRQVANAFDEKVRDPQSVLDLIRTAIPGAADEVLGMEAVKTKKDDFGNDRERYEGQSGLRALLPLQSSEDRRGEQPYRYYGSESKVQDLEIGRAIDKVQKWMKNPTESEPTDKQIELYYTYRNAESKLYQSERASAKYKK